MTRLTRRDYLNYLAALYGSSGVLSPTAQASPSESQVKPKSLAAVMTVYRPNSHAHVIIGKILEGWEQDGGAGPALTLASMYVDQFPAKDLARAMAKKHGVPLFDSIEKAVTVGGDRIPVDGVISIGEHGDYPTNDKGQHLYPRRRFFEEITNTFQKYGKVVPVFSDKHLGPVWSDAQWMYDRSRALKVPFMAGSSLPVTFRTPEITVPLGSEMEAAVGIGHGGLDSYGCHSLDCYQCLVERRRGSERGVKWVQYLDGDAMWKVVDDGVVPKDVLDAGLALQPKMGNTDPRKDKRASLFLFEYLDGFMGAQFMLPTVTKTAVALKIKGHKRPFATHFEERAHPRYPHFAYLLKAIECMMHTGSPSYPVERTLLTSGILDRAITSRSQKGKKLMTPELTIAYQPVDYPHAPNPKLILPPPR